jgi:protein-tyrosine phosphatase
LIDLHCHILPETDDGPDTLEESLEMAQKAVADGIQTIVATPHNHNGVYINAPHTIRARVDDLNDALTAHRIPLTVLPGAEEHFRPDLASAELCCLDPSGRYVLVEFPFMTIPGPAADVLHALRRAGRTPILAHPERNAVIQNHPDVLLELVTTTGALCQITAMSLTGELGEAAMNCAYQLVLAGLAHIIASDAHSAGFRRPALSSAVAVAASLLHNPEQARNMVWDIPLTILAGKTNRLPQPTGFERPRKRWFSW